MVGESDSASMNTGSNPSGSKDSETLMQATFYYDYIDCCFNPLSKCCREQRNQSGSKDSESPMQASRPVECLGIDCGFAHGHKCCRGPRNQSGSKVEEKWIKQAAFRLKAETENPETPKQADKVGLGVLTKDSETPMQAGVRYATPMECCMNPNFRCCHRSCRCRRSQSGSGWIQEQIRVEEKSIKQAAFRLKAETKNLETPKQAGKVGLGVQTKDSEIDCCFDIPKNKDVKAE